MPIEENYTSTDTVVPKYSEAAFHPLRPMETLAFGIILATLYPLLVGYSYGTIDHVDHLPMFYRQLDDSYLVNDFAVNASTHFGPRTYYLQILSPLANFVPLPIVFLILNWMVNFGTIMVTFLAAKDLFEGSHVVAMIACVLVVGTVGINLGGNGNLSSQYLVPSSLVIPLALSSIWAGIRGKAITCAIIASIGSFIHPVVGLETGAIGLAVVGLSVFLAPDIFTNRLLAKKVAPVFVGASILGAAAYIPWISKYVRILDADQFINIVAHFRHPHEVLPSTWPIFGWVEIICFLFAFVVSWNWWRNSISLNRVMTYKILTPVMIVLLLWCGGYVFVELLLCRLWATAQTFRISFIVNWIGFIVISGTIVRIFVQQNGSVKARGWLILMGSGSTQPIFALLDHLVELFQMQTKKILTKTKLNLL